MVYVDRNNQTNEITGVYFSKQYDGQELISKNHADVSSFKIRGKISQIREIRNRKLDEIDTKFCNAQKWSAMTQTEKDSWVAVKEALIALTDKDANGNYIKLTALTVDGYLDHTQNVWPW